MQSSDKAGEFRAEPVRAPEPTRGTVRERAEFQRYRAEREGLERRSMLRGLIVLAVVVLVLSIARAGLDRVFVPGWWRSCADSESKRHADQKLVYADDESGNLLSGLWGGPARWLESIR